jgi:hypothetical protein
LPSKADHLLKAEGNESFATTITPESQPKIDWALVVLFYAAVHYIEAYLAAQFNMHVRSHTTRDGWVGRDSTLRRTFNEYQHLKFYGYNARYEMFGFTAADVADATTDLAKVKANILAAI